jgi:DNA-binding CsgD family transcriptional regulator
VRGARTGSAVDALVAAALGAAAVLEIWTPSLVPGVGDVVGNRPVLTVTALVATAALAARRRWPVAVLLVVLAALALQPLITTPTEGLVPLLTGLLAAYSSSAHSTARRGALAGGMIVLGAGLLGQDAGDWAFLAVVLGGAWLVGFVVMERSSELMQAQRDNRELSARLAEAVAQLVDAQRDAEATATRSPVSGLTQREVDVARAIARGMSNAEIAAELFISEWTVKTHVGSILRKLALRDRAQVVVAAYESGLVSPRAALSPAPDVAPPS